MSSEDQESQGLDAEGVRALIKQGDIRSRWYAIILLIIGIWPWTMLHGPAPSYGALQVVMFGSVIILPPVFYVWIFLWGRAFRYRSVPIIVILVIELTMCVEGGFAQIYYEMSAHSPHSFDPYPLSGIDAAYFTISTATTSGIGDIHPVSGAARLLVSAQMIANVYLVVVAITTAVQRARPRDDRATLERHLANDERTRDKPTEPGATAADPTG